MQDPNEDRSFHTVITADGSATHWQSRVGYYHFLKVKKACMARGKCQMVRSCWDAALWHMCTDATCARCTAPKSGAGRAVLPASAHQPRSMNSS
jgi:hypothetical protein